MDVPRVAKSLEDLRVGQVVAWCDAQGIWTAGASPINETSLGDWDRLDIERGVVILSDAPDPEPPAREKAYEKWADTGSKFSTRGGQPREVFYAGWDATALSVSEEGSE